MLFAHDTEVALAAAAALVNTAGTDGEKLPDLAALDEFFEANRWTGKREHTKAELRAVQDLRPRLRRIWEAGEDDVAGFSAGASDGVLRYLPGQLGRPQPE